MTGPLAGLTVVVARDDAPDDDISLALVAAGAVVVPLPLMRVEAIDDVDTIARVSAGLAAANVVAVTSRHAAAALLNLKPPTAAMVAAVGEATASALRGQGWTVDVVGTGGGAALAALLGPRVSGQRVFLPRALGAHEGLADGLRAAGAFVDIVDVYRAIPIVDDAAIAFALAGARPRALVLTSPRRVEVLARRGAVPDDVIVVAIGETTAMACRACGLTVHATPSQPAPDPVCAALTALHTPP